MLLSGNTQVIIFLMMINILWWLYLFILQSHLKKQISFDQKDCQRTAKSLFKRNVYKYYFSFAESMWNSCKKVNILNNIIHFLALHILSFQSPVLSFGDFQLACLGHLNLLLMNKHPFTWQEWTRLCFLISRVVWGVVFPSPTVCPNTLWHAVFEVRAGYATHF